MNITLENVRDDALFMFDQPAQEIDFNKKINISEKEISSVDSIFVKREHPNKSLPFKSSGLGDLELEIKPNKFTIYELSKQKNLIKLSAQGKFSRLNIGRGELKRDLVPYLVSFIRTNPTVSVIISFLAWLIPLIIPYIIKSIKKET